MRHASAIVLCALLACSPRPPLTPSFPGPPVAWQGVDAGACPRVEPIATIPIERHDPRVPLVVGCGDDRVCLFHATRAALLVTDVYFDGRAARTRSIGGASDRSGLSATFVGHDLVSTRAGAELVVTRHADAASTWTTRLPGTDVAFTRSTSLGGAVAVLAGGQQLSVTFLDAATGAPQRTVALGDPGQSWGQACLTAVGERLFAGWLAAVPGTSEPPRWSLHGAWIDATAGTARAIAVTAVPQTAEQLACAGGQADVGVVVLDKQRGDLHFARVSDEEVTPWTLAIAGHEALYFYTSPAIVADVDRFVVAWDGLRAPHRNRGAHTPYAFVTLLDGDGRRTHVRRLAGDASDVALLAAPRGPIMAYSDRLGGALALERVACVGPEAASAMQ